MKNIIWVIILYILVATNMTAYAQITQITDFQLLECVQPELWNHHSYPDHCHQGDAAPTYLQGIPFNSEDESLEAGDGGDPGQAQG